MRIKLSFKLLVIIVIAGFCTLRGAQVALTESAAQQELMAQQEADARKAEPAQSLVQNLMFASGEVIAYDEITQTLTARVFLDLEGNASAGEIKILINDDTEITDGDAPVDPVSFKPDQDVDMEYDLPTMTATYLFVY